MRRTSLTVLALAALLTAAGCGDVTESPGGGGQEPTSSPDPGKDDGADDDPSEDDPGEDDEADDDEAEDPTAQEPPGDADLIADTRGEGEFMIGDVSVRVAESDPVQLFLDVQGDAPTPCHAVAYDVEQDGDTISVWISTVVGGDSMCTQVLAPHEFAVPLGEVEDLPVTVEVNGGEHSLTAEG